MQISSPAFANQEAIPPIYTCDGDGINPPLEISDVPAEAQSLVLIVDDPDAPNGTFDHWLLWNINPTITEIPEGTTPAEAVAGTNSARKTGYIPPCPPEGVHHYRFMLSALNKLLTLEPGADRDELEEAIKNAVIARAELVGLYSPEYPRG
ncbi:YbhB/YbcL family Raf kinase inhibitor-like protein [Patescibacteria group bacterium]|nr:YbhB/YbcL family Raf kinase inhibitor-like protein [Patescibacteria group bacterium]